MTGSPNLGEASFGFVADGSQVDKELDRIRQEIEAFVDEVESEAKLSETGLGEEFTTVGDKAEDAGKRGRRSFSQLSEELQATASRQVGVITGFAGIAAGIGAVAAGSFLMGREIRRALENQPAKDFRRDIDAISDGFASSAKGAARFADALTPGESAFRSIRDAARQAEQAVIDQTSAAIENRNVFQQLADLAKFGSAGFRGDRTTLAIEAEKELGEIAIESGKALRVAAQSAEKVNDALIKSARLSIKDALEPPSELERDLRAVDEQISSIQTRISSANADQREELEQTIDALRELRKELGRRSIAESVREWEEANTEARKNFEMQATDLREQAEQIRREELEPLQREVLETQDALADARKQLAEIADPAVRAALLDKIDALGGKLDGLRKDQAEQAAKSKADMTDAVRAGITAAIGTTLERISQDLRVTSQGIEGIGDR